MSALSVPITADPTEPRRQRGLVIAAVCKIEQRHDQWIVPSQTGNGSHRVNLKPLSRFVPRCTCKDYEARGKPCKHIFAVEAVIQGLSRPDGPVDDSETTNPAEAITRRTCAPRPTYKQDWPAYDAAQIHEKEKFQAILSDLCRGVPEPPPASPKGGRPPVPMADRMFAVALKVYTTISGRRASTDMRDARDKGHISHAPHFTRVSRFLEDPAMTPILRGLIAESAKPLASVEVDFAVDSSGFTTSRFVRWFDAKYGQPKQEYDWVKVSLMCGVKTNIVTAVEIDERYAGDCPKFAPLVKATAEHFTLREVSADAAYLSYDNMDLVARLGGTPYIAFPSNTTAAQGGTLAKMFHLYNFRRDNFLDHYHKRSNVETTFSMVKAKFGDHLRSKTDTAMVNEALCKVLCHNVCVLIQSTYELGIEATFWGQESVNAAHVADVTEAPDAIMGYWEWI